MKWSSDLPARTLAAVRRHNRRVREQTPVVIPDAPQYTGPGVSERDPVLVSDSVTGLINERGWQRNSAAGAVIGRWSEIVGAAIADHVTPVEFDERNATLRVVADSSTWATQVQLLVPDLLKRMDAEVGAGMVKSIDITTNQRRYRH